MNVKLQIHAVRFVLPVVPHMDDVKVTVCGLLMAHLSLVTYVSVSMDIRVSTVHPLSAHKAVQDTVHVIHSTSIFSTIKLNRKTGKGVSVRKAGLDGIVV